jgi:hypothetical protein
MTRMPFGKHKGKPLGELPDEYLDWLSSLVDLREPFKTAVRQEVAVRRNSGKPSAALALNVINAGYRKLAIQTHPDHGGAVDAMQALNTTITWLRRQVEISLCK